MTPRPASLLRRPPPLKCRLSGFLLASRMSVKIEIAAGRKQQAYDYYIHHPAVSLKTIATFLGVSVRTFSRLRKAWDWPPRHDLPVQEENAADAETEDVRQEQPAASSLREAALSLASVTRSHIDALVKEQRTKRGADHDKTARTLASYAKTLTAARALLEQEGSTLDDSEPHDTNTPRSIHELRDELAQHLERIIAEEEALGGDGLLV